MAAKAQWDPGDDVRCRRARVRPSPLALDDPRRGRRPGRGPGRDRRPSAGATPSRSPRCSPSIPSASGRSTSTCCTRSRSASAAASSRPSRRERIAPTTATRTTSTWSSSTGGRPRFLMLLAVPLTVGLGALLVTLIAGPVPLGALISAAIAGYCMVFLYEWTHFLIHTAYRPRSAPTGRSGGTTASTTSRTSTSGTGSPTTSATGSSARTPISATCRSRRQRARSTRAARGEPLYPRRLERQLRPRARRVVHADSSTAAATASATSARGRTESAPTNSSG